MATNLKFKSGTQFWSKFAVSQRHEIFLETKPKVCYMTKSLSLSIVAFNFFSLEYSNFPQAVALGTHQLILRRGGGYGIFMEREYFSNIL